ncbi:DUF4097 family beta strand repeat-containing protein [Paenisporosarcina antarctica]|uniref:DUF1700 domain-containing protein n=1 Tax=Paenisporosarcina antarctica TaxID=417367 RepID=A0A4P6ZXP2_9BACL|nr:DUF4097 family beta strand repeat-containing protein [Paenisporosarcina antarctica]QBP41221.1 DUF1700 domain-containing protein [Paenisporosarcina antarctica]
MEKSLYLEELKNELGNLKPDELKDIISDFNEYFANGNKDGKTDLEIIESLGTSKFIASELLKAYTEDDMIPENLPVAGEYRKVDMQIENGHLTIEPSHDEIAHVNMSDHSNQTLLSMDVMGDTLMIKVKQSRRFFPFGIGMKVPVVSVKLPVRMYESIKVNNDNGSTKGHSLRAEVVAIESDNGRIELSQVVATQLRTISDNGRIMLTKVQVTELEVESDNGRLELSNVKADVVRAKSDNGRIELHDVQAMIEAKTDNGRIVGYVKILTRPISLKTDNGSIELTMNHKPEHATIRVDRDWGKVSVFGEKSRDMIFGDGSVLIQLSSDNGSITVKEA